MLLLALLGQAVFGSVRLSLTTDEPMHIAMGYTELATGDYSLLPAHIHPPLVNEWAAWPLLLRPDRPDPRQVPGWDEGNLWKFSAQLLAQLGPVESVELATRVPIMLLALLLGALVYRWASDLLGARAGPAGAVPVCVRSGHHCPARSSTRPTSARWRLGCWRRLSPGAPMRASHPPARIALIGSGAGHVHGRQSVGPVLCAHARRCWSGLTLLRAHWGQWNRCSANRSCAGRCALLLIYALALGVVWAAYRFEFEPLPGVELSHSRRIALACLAGIQPARRGRTPGAFLAGQVSQHGWWWYFPLALCHQDAPPHFAVARDRPHQPMDLRKAAHGRGQTMSGCC